MIQHINDIDIQFEHIISHLKKINHKVLVYILSMHLEKVCQQHQ